MFIPEGRIEKLASELWQQYSLAPGFDIEALLDDLGLGLTWEAVPDQDGYRILGQLIPEEEVVVLNERYLPMLEERGGRLRRFTIGHEVGHWKLHSDAVRSGTLRLFDDKRIWCRDGSTEPPERQAEMFAAALLIPRDQLKAALPKSSWRGWPTVYGLADKFLVNVTPMAIRLERLGWMHRDNSGAPRSGRQPLPGQGALFT